MSTALRKVLLCESPWALKRFKSITYGDEGRVREREWHAWLRRGSEFVGVSVPGVVYDGNDLLG